MASRIRDMEKEQDDTWALVTDTLAETLMMSETEIASLPTFTRLERAMLLEQCAVEVRNSLRPAVKVRGRTFDASAIEEHAQLFQSQECNPSVRRKPNRAPLSIKTVADLVLAADLDEQKGAHVQQQLEENDLTLDMILEELTLESLLTIKQDPVQTEDITKVWNVRNQLSAERNDFTKWDVEATCKWLETVDDKYIDKFRQTKVNGLGLVLLTLEDLQKHLGFNLGSAMKIMKAIWELKQKMPSAREALYNKTTDWERQNELVRVPMTTLCLSLSDNWENLKAHASTLSYSPVITFTGQTAAGKSRIVTELLSFEDRMQQRIPTVAVEGQNKSTTGNVVLFRGELPTRTLRENEVPQKRSIFLLDVEGENGTLPRLMEEDLWSMLESWKRQLKNMVSKMISSEKHSVPETIQDFQALAKKRMEFVSTEVPKLSYLISNIVVYIDRQPMHNKAYIKRILDLTNRLSPNVPLGDKPHLILVQNFCSDNDETSYEVAVSSGAFLQVLANHESMEINAGDNKGDIASIRNKFATISFVKIPDSNGNEKLYNTQVVRFKDLLVERLQDTRCFTLAPNNFFTEYHWFEVVSAIVREISYSEKPINMSSIFSRVCEPREETLAKVSTFFGLVYEKLYPKVVVTKTWLDSQQLRPYVEARRQVFENCLRLGIFKYADLFVQKWIRENIALTKGHLMKERTRMMLNNHFGKCLTKLMERAPCGFIQDKFVCEQEKKLHEEHVLYSPYLLRWWNKKPKEKEFVFNEINEKELQESFFEEALVLIELGPHQLHQRRADNLRALFGTSKGDVHNIDIDTKTNCLLCMENRGHSLLSCGHTFCAECNQLSMDCYDKYFKCAICDENVCIIDRQIPRLSRPRVLCLDGGGIRGVVMLELLKGLQRHINIPPHELFDLIAGTSAGAIISAGLVGKRPLSELIALYERLRKEVFANTMLNSMLPSLMHIALIGPLYDVNELQSCLQKIFGDQSLLDIAADPSAPQAYIFSSFVSHHTVMSAKVWEATSASAAAPTYFNSFTHKGNKLLDGGLSANNPSQDAFLLASAFWERDPGLLLSLGTGLPEYKDFSENIGGTIQTIIDMAVNSEQIGKTTAELCGHCTTPCIYHRLNVPGIGAIELDDTSDFSLQNMLRAAQQECIVRKSELRKLSINLIARSLYIDDKERTEMRFVIRSRINSEMQWFADNYVIWKTGDDKFMKQKVSLKVDIESVNDRVALAVLSKCFKDHCEISFVPEHEGIYSIDAYLLNHDTREKFMIASSPCIMHVERSIATGFRKDIGEYHRTLENTLKIKVLGARLTLPCTHCKIQVLGNTEETARVSSTNMPTWGSELSFALENSTDSSKQTNITISLFNHPEEGQGSLTRFLGSVSLPLHIVKPSHNVRLWRYVHAAEPEKEHEKEREKEEEEEMPTAMDLEADDPRIIGEINFWLSRA